jgi:ATP-dependent Clp protease ATP-binding subunit ClpA
MSYWQEKKTALEWAKEYKIKFINFDGFPDSEIDIKDELFTRIDFQKYLGSCSVEINDMPQFIADAEKELKEHPYPEEEKKEIICMCGSMRFRNEFSDAEMQLALRGHIVIMPYCMHATKETEKIVKENKAYFDEQHKKKIDMCDIVFVVDAHGGYIGESTSAEIEYAESKGKRIVYYSTGDMIYQQLTAPQKING